MVNKDVKLRLIRWVLLLQEFNLYVKGRKGAENQIANHLSKLKDEAMQELGEKAGIDDTFLNEHVLTSFHDLIPWFIDFSNYVLSNLSFHQSKKFMHDVTKGFWR